ncbi:putative c6 zinc finger domain-containing protein [Diplodia seriata]|uniref:Putative c6 zinc finger domain-containing protein n=1 Tax=Diplodia seriata TaxID=420778 RepID=A0A0G2E8N5_9PEZI|nr:putative c6 zinc finger domain-containing protein [Diplodia seriata]
MHGLLAVSALHYGHTNPSDKETYSLLSARHQALALNWFSGQLHININEDDNYNAQIFLGSIVFIFPVFAVAEAGREGRLVATHDVVQAFVLLKGECDDPYLLHC